MRDGLDSHLKIRHRHTEREARASLLAVGWLRMPAGFPLSVQRIERLFETFFGRLSRVDRAPDYRSSLGVHWASIEPSCLVFTPKKSGPDHRVPVISLAISERLS